MTPSKTPSKHSLDDDSGDVSRTETARSQEDIIRSLEVSRALGQAAHGASLVRVGHLEIQAREYQSEVWGAIQAAREAGEEGALVHLATGLGKTTVGVADALRFADDFIEQEGRAPNILFAVHQTEILDQAAERFEAVESGLTLGRYDGKTKDLSKTVTFATLQSLHKNLENLDPEQFDYIIYDEVHHAQAETFKKVVEHFKPKFKLGLTATPDRMDDKDIRDLFGREIYSKPLAEAMTEGYLADVDYHIVFDEAVKKAMESGFNPTTMKEVQELLENESRNEEIAEQIREKMEEIGLENAKTIIFCQNIQQADQMASLLGGRSYHSGLKKGERVETLEAFKKNGLQVITTRDMFNEGVDIPDARLIIFLRSTSSKTVFEQQLGRGLRKHAGKDTVSVLDFVANIERLTYVKELVEEIKRVRDNQVLEGGSTKGRDGEPEGGFSLSTTHADFDFDKISVDLLERLAEAREKLDLKDLAKLWRSNFGDQVPTHAAIKEASEAGLFVSSNIISARGGVKALRRELGISVAELPESMGDLAKLWRSNFGDQEPTRRSVNEASKAGSFVPTSLVNKLGGLMDLKRALGFDVFEWPETVDELAKLWVEKTGGGSVTRRTVYEASRQGIFISPTGLGRYGGLDEFRAAVARAKGERSEWPDDVEGLARIWIELFGDTYPSRDRVISAAKEGKFISRGLKKYGGIHELQKAFKELRS